MKNSKTTNATNTKYDILNKNNNKSKNYNNCTLKTNAKRLTLKPPKVINKNPLINIKATIAKIIIFLLSLAFIFTPPYYHIKENYASYNSNS